MLLVQIPSADLLGPLLTGDSVLVVVDFFFQQILGGYGLEVHKTFSPIFARFRVPYSMRIDNSPQFLSE